VRVVCENKRTDCGNADTPVLKRQITALFSWKKAQNLARGDNACLSTTDAFEVPNEKDALSVSHDHEISTVPGYMSYIEGGNYV